MKTIRGLCGVLLAATALNGAWPERVVAQEPGQAGALEEVVVTARAREERLQTVPLAITAFSSDDLAKRAVNDMRDVARLTPGFAFEEYSGSSNTSPVIRGATQIAGSTEQPVSFFLDGVYLPRSYVTDIGFTGIERIEIVKGPQSARYGRNAFMGAVNYIARKPGDTWQGDLQGTLGSYSRRDLGGTVSGPLLDGKIGVIASANYSEFDGSWKNQSSFCDIGFGLGTDCRVGGYEKTTYSLGTTISPVEDLEININYFNIESQKEQLAKNVFGELNHNSGVMNCGQFNPNVRPAGSGTGGGGQWFRLYCGELPIAPVDAVDPRAYGAQTEADLARANLSYAFTEALSFGYTYGYVNAKVSTNGFSDFGPTCQYFIPGACVFSNVGTSRNRTESHDARISFDNGGMFRASIGYLYASDRDITQSAFATAPPLTAVPSAPLNAAVASNYLLYVVLGQTLTRNKISSPFAEASVTLMDGKLRLGAEGRYTEEKRYQQALASGGAGGVLAVTGLAFNATYNSFTPRFTVDYNLTPDNLLYASAAKGVKSGGFNTTAFLPENRTFDEDTNWTYEIGTKNTFGNFRFNANVFMVKWSDQQIPAADPGNPAVLPIVITLNLGNSTSTGVEFEGAWAATDRLTFNGAAYYGEATYDRNTFQLNFARTPAVCDNVVCPRNGEISGNDTPRAPRVMATLGAEWAAPLGGSRGLSYSLRGDVSYQSKAYADEMNLAWVPSRTVANASIGLEAERYDVQVWIKNLFDEEYAAVSSIQQPNVKYDSTLGERRTLGLTARFKF